MAESTGMTRLESFPFTSHDDGYDADGYPVYDRAVGSGMLRDTFEKFFTNGIFPNPGTAMQIGKASSGLAVTIQPGIGIIKGAMGGIRGDQPITVTLDTQAPQGNVAYGIMLRFDNTDGFADSRSLLINVVRGDASSSPTPPAPDTTTPEVYELRLGYVVVPSGATDLSNATVTNEKGLSVCPYAAPFEEIDVSGIVSDFKVSADEALANLLEYYNANKAAIDAALSDSEATYLQQQISALQEQLENFDLAGSVDDQTIEYATAPGEVESKLRVKDGGIGSDQIGEGAVVRDGISDGAVYREKLSDLLKIELGIYDWSEMTTAQQFLDLYQNGNQEVKTQAVAHLFQLSWQDIASSVYSVSNSDLSELVGKSKQATAQGIGTFNFTLIGVGVDDISGGGKAKLTFQCQNVVTQMKMFNTGTSTTRYESSLVNTYLAGTFKNSLQDGIQSVIKNVSKTYFEVSIPNSGGDVTHQNRTYTADVWICRAKELGDECTSYDDGSLVYDYYSSGGSRVKNYSGSPSKYWTSDCVTRRNNYQGLPEYLFNLISTSGTSSNVSYANSDDTGVVPCFCI